MPHSARADFLAQFEPEVLPYVLEYANRISSLKADILVFTARKAACLFDAFRSVGLAIPAGQVVSDRVMDMDLGWVRGKSVVLIDDVLVTGSTLHLQKKQLIESGAASVELLVLAVNVDFWVPQLALPDYPYLELDDGAALYLCSQIVDALSLVPRPYNLDWPLIDGISTGIGSLANVGGLPGWRMQDRASSLQLAAQVANLSHSASSRTISRLEARSGFDMPGLRMAKVRIYGRRSTTHDGRIDLRILPLVGLDDVSTEKVREAFESVVYMADPSIVRSFVSPTSQMRLVQFVIAARLGQIWLEDLRDAAEFRGDSTIKTNQLAFAFAPNVVPMVEERSTFSGAFPPAVIPTFAPPESIETDVSGAAHGSMWDVQAALTEPFMDLYRTKELPTRQILKELGPAAFSNKELEAQLNRLHRGYSYSQLREVAVSVLGDDQEADRIVSAFLDIAIDHGVIVPVMQIRDGLVRRAYRHGEDIVFASNELRLFGILAHSFLKSSNRTALPKLVLEKLFVIYLRIGLSSKHLNRWNGRLGASGTVGVRWNLKGAVVQLDAEALYGSNPGNGLAEFLVKAGMLERRQRGEGYILTGSLPAAPTRPDHESLARKTGYLFGELAAASNRAARLSSADLTLLASIDTLPSLLGALAAEINIIRSAWAGLGFRLRSLGRDDPRGNETALRRSTLYEAANSGCWKFLSYREGVPEQIVERIAESIKSPIVREEWIGYWPRPIANEAASAPQAYDLASIQGRWLLAADVHLKLASAALLHLAGDPEAAGSMIDDAVSRGISHADYSPEGASAPLEDARLAQAQLNRGTLNADSLLSTSIRKLDVLSVRAESILDRTRAVANPFGEPRQYFSYSHALYLRVEGSRIARERFEESYGLAFNKVARAALDRKSHIAEIKFPELPQSRVVVARGPRAAQYLTELALDLLARAPAGLEIRGCLLVDLGENERAYSGGEGGGFQAGALSRLLVELAHDPVLEIGAGVSLTVLGPAPVTASRRRAYVDEVTSLVRKRVGHDSSKERITQVAGGRIGTTFADLTRALARTQEKGNDMLAAGADVGIVTVIPVEARAVNDWLSTMPDYSHGPGRDGRYFYTGTLQTSDGPVRLAMTAARHQGSNAALTAHTSLAETFRPKLIVLLGIAGSIHADARLGDVVFGESIIDYSPSAETSGGLRHRGSAHPVSSRIAAGINHFFVQHDESVPVNPSDSAEALGSDGFRIHYGPIGSGYAVVKYRDSPIRIWLEEFNEKTLVIETEASGAASYFYERADLDGIRDFLVIRGVSDHADVDKDDSWQQAASENAVIALEMLLRAIAQTIVAPNSGEATA